MNLRHAIFRYLLLAIAALFAALAIMVPLDLNAQWVFAAIAIAGTIVLARLRTRHALLALGILSLIVSTRYMFWRTTQTLEFGTVAEFLLGSGLYLAEIYVWVILVLAFVQTAFPLNREVVEIQGEPQEWPCVDVFIPTYNESLDIVRNTVFAAMDMDYPADRFRVFILDDGRRPEFQTFARQAGCGYLTRADNLHAKAGNLNAAIKKTGSELIAIFDCDHVPTRVFLQMTVGWFQRDPKLALMQTPHHFYSPDPVQRNLGTVRDLPGEGDLFYGVIQTGNDLWNATFFCGSCAIIRREALAETQGFAGETVTEDAHTALKLQRSGWNTAYIDARLSAGLATERLVLHIGQRIRWARGMTQILRIDNPLFGPGLTWQQRLCYLSAMLYYQFPLPRIAFLTSPLAYLLFGQNIIHASASMIFAYVLPHLYCSMTNSGIVHGSTRRPFWGEIYDTILAFHLVKPTLVTWLQPRKGKFNVTDKGSTLESTYVDLATVRPHLLCIGLILLGIVIGFVKLLFFPHLFNIQADTLMLNCAWATLSLVILIAAVSVARETRQSREHIRIDTELPVTLYMADGHVIDANTRDISMGGVSVAVPIDFPLRDRRVTHISLPMGDEKLTIPVDVIRHEPGEVNLRFQELDMMQSRHLVRAVLGRADAWEPSGPRRPVSALRSLWDIIVVDFVTLKRLFRLNRKELRQEKKARMNAAPIAKQAALTVLGLLCLSASSLLLTPRAEAQTKDAAAVASAAPGVRKERLTFRDLQVKAPIRLAGTRGEMGIPFGMRRNEVVTNSSLTLSFAWSPAMLGDLSQLVVLLNGEVVRTLPLHPGESGGQNITIPVNPALFLPGDNQLNLRLIGHYTRDNCEDGFHSSLWANISNVRSWFDLTVQTLPLAPDLSRLPAPFFDRHDNLPLRLPLVFAGAPRPAELEAAASLTSWLGAQASYRGFSFKPVYGQIPSGNAILFLTPDRQLPGISLPISGPSATVIRNPRDSFSELLVVMGRNSQELKLAAAAIASGRGVLGGARMSFEGARIPTYARYAAPRWLRTDRPVRLGEIMNATALQGQGLPPGPLSAQFRVAPDLFFWPRQGGRLDLRYRYPVAPWLDRRASRLDISLNSQFLRTLPLAGSGLWESLFGVQNASSQDSTASIVLPRYNLFGQNELIFDYNLMIADKNPAVGKNKQKCEGWALPENVRVSIRPTSSIDLSRAYHALRMPDLAAFAGAGYPFTIRPDLSETTVLMGKQPSPGAVEAFLTLMGRMGDATGAPVTGVTVANNINPDRLAGNDIIVIGASSVAESEQLFGRAPVRYMNGRLHVTEMTPVQRVFALFSPFNRADHDEATGFVADAEGFSGLVGFESPFESGRSVIALLADDPNLLPQLVDGMADVKINAQIQGDLAVTSGDGMSSFAVGPGYWVGYLPFWMKAAFWLSSRPFLLAACALLAALILAGPLYLYLSRQQRRRLNAGEEE